MLLAHGHGFDVLDRWTWEQVRFAVSAVSDFEFDRLEALQRTAAHLVAKDPRFKSPPLRDQREQAYVDAGRRVRGRRGEISAEREAAELERQLAQLAASGFAVEYE